MSAVFALLLLLPGCAKKSASTHRLIQHETIPLAFPIDQVQAGPRSRIVINSASDFKRAWTFVTQDIVPYPAQIDSVDWHKNTVLLLASAIHPGDWTVRVDDVYTTDSVTRVHVVECTDNTPVDVLVRGIAVIKLPYPSEPVVFDEGMPETPCKR